MRRVVDDDLDEFFGRAAPAPTSITAASGRGRSAPDGATKVRSQGDAARHGTSRARTRPRTPTPTRPGRPRAVGDPIAPRPALLDRAGRGATRPPRPSSAHRGGTGSRSPRLGPGSQARTAPRRARASTAPDGATARRRTLRRLVWLVVAFVAVVGAVTVRLTTVQLSNSERWIAWGQEQRDGWRELPAGRGGIYDRNGQALAMSVIQPDVVADPGNVEDKEATARTLAPILGKDVEELVRALSVDGDYALLAASVPTEVAEEIEALRTREDEQAADGTTARTLAGVSLQDRFVRFYPSGDLATSVVGRTVANGGVDENGRQGVAGIEAQFESELTGEPGRLYFEHDPSGRTIAGGAETVEPARPGTNLYLTIDQSLQYESERAIGAQVEATGASSGMVLMMRPSTGEILSMASVAVDGDGEVVNTRDARPVTAVFEPGSVNKMITVAGALEEGIMSPETMLDVPDHLTIYDKTFTDHDPHPVRSWSVTDILVTSSNIGTIKIAQTLGRERVDGYLREFGLGQTTGLGFPNEENGIMLPLDDWSGTSIGAIPIGQGIAVTALQMLSAYNVIANDGVYVAPKLVAATDSGEGREPTEPAEHRQVVSTDTARAMQTMLEKVVTDGTGENAQVPDYPAAGKTGTARIPQGVDATDGYLGTDGRYHYQSTFLGFVNGADLSILVTLQDPQTSTYGGVVAAPVFSQLAGVALLRSQTPPPALLERSDVDVPELSATAREVAGEDAEFDSSAAAG